MGPGLEGVVPALVLFFAALATSILSAIVGMAGGITLLAVMLLFLEPLVAIPLHGVVQLVSNGSRTWFQRRHVDPGIVLRYSALLVPAAFAGLAVARELPPSVLRCAIGCFVLLATWAPQALLLGTHPERVNRTGRFLLLGAGAGFLNMTVGATGPLIAPFFLNLGLTRFALVGTKAACQLLGHVSKVLVFGVVGFGFPQYALLLAVLCALVVMGTAIGTRILSSVDERSFVLIYKTVLTAIAVHLVVRELWNLTA